MEELKLRLLSDDFGKHLMGVEDLLQKHSLVEADINVLAERVKQVVQHSQRFLDEESSDGYRPCDPSIIVERVQALEDAYAELVKLAVAVLLGHGRGGKLDQGDAEHPAPGRHWS